MASALFEINDDGEDRGFEATASQALAFKLRSIEGVDTVVFQVWSPTTFDAESDIARNPPRASKGAPTLDLVGATSGQSVSPVTKGAEVTTTMAPGAASYIVRCIVNDGRRTLPSGERVVDPTLIHERGVFVPVRPGVRKPVITETTQFEVDGWAGTISDWLENSLPPAPDGMPSITGVTTQEQIDSIVEALVGLGLATDDR